MILAQRSDVEAVLGRELTSPEQARVNGLLEEASDLVTAWCRPDGADFFTQQNVPDVVRRVTARMVARVITSGTEAINLSAQTTVVGPYQRSHTFNTDATSGGPWLTRVDKIALKPHRLVYVQNFTTH